MKQVETAAARPGGRWLKTAGQLPAAGWLAILAVLLLLGGLTTWRNYFQHWSQRSDLFYESDGDLAAVAGYLDSRLAAGETVYLAALHYRHPTIAFLSQQYERVRWLPGSQALVFPPAGPAVYIFPHNSPAPEWAAPYLAGMSVTEGEMGSDQQPAYLVYRSSRPPAITPSRPVQVNFSNQVTLLGYDVGQGQAGQTVPLMLYWRVERQPTAAWLPFAHLLDNWGYRWSQLEANAYPAEQWQPGEIIVQRLDVPLPAGLPPNLYQLRVGLFDPAGGQQLAILDEAGRYAGNILTIEAVIAQAGPPPQPLPRPPLELNLPAAPGLTLLGYKQGADRVQAGADLWLELWWLASTSLNPMTLRLELIRPDHTGRILLNSQPAHNSYPFAAWSPPQFVIDHQSPRLPLDLLPGQYLLSLRLLSAADETLMTADLGPLIVEPSDRLFTPPPVPFPMDAVLGREIALIGYDLQPAAGGQAALTLFWQAVTEPAADYTVFIHVLDQAGLCCVWQADNMPRQGTYPTSSWLEGEVVEDSYTILLPADLPPGRYPLEIGLYLADSGTRLRVEVPGLPTGDVLFLTPLEAD